jgi:muramoyltetrapeptide carboxypeptidase
MSIQPPYLRKGDTIGIVCPSGYLPLEDTNACVQQLQEWGFRVRIGVTVGNKYHGFAGTDEERCADLQQMLDDPSIHAILCGRGGYGMSRIIDRLDFRSFRKSPKWIIGFSDITLLHAHLFSRLHISSFHASMARAFADKNSPNIKTLHSALTGKISRYQCLPHQLNRRGEAVGPLIGGNLSLLAHITGTQTALPKVGAILFLEDVGEYLYNIERMFIQLKRSGLFSNLTGLVVGGFTETKDSKIPFGATVEELISAQVEEFSFPVCFGFPVSHADSNVALKHGAMHRLRVTGRSVLFEELK